MLIKLSKRHVQESELIAEMRARVKRDPTVIRKFKEYGVPLSELDRVPISFADLDVSAKTKDKKIYINRALITDKSPEDITHYLVHESTHLCQQMTGHTDDGRVKKYIDKPTEMEAFKAQVDYKEREEGGSEAEEYVEELTDYHNLKGKERQEKKEQLLGKK